MWRLCNRLILQALGLCSASSFLQGKYRCSGVPLTGTVDHRALVGKSEPDVQACPGTSRPQCVRVVKFELKCVYIGCR